MRFPILISGLAVSALVGCASDPYLKTPQLVPRSAAAELRAAEFHDPFPSDDIGPKTFSRPREFQAPRTQTRQAAELRSWHLLPPNETLPPESNRPAKRYSQVVAP